MQSPRLALAALLVTFTAAPALAGKSDNSIRVASYQVVDNFDSYFNTSLATTIIGHQIFDSLLYRDPRSGEYKGQLASSWKRIDDRTLEFELRKGVTFHNGAKFDADDVVFTLNYVANPENKTVRQSNVSWIERVEKVDPYKVRIVTKAPFPAAVEYLATVLYIYPHEHYAKGGPAALNEKAIGSGPFRVLEYVRGKHVRMERNPDYFKDSPRPAAKIDKLELRFIPDQQTQTAEVLAGGLDLVWDIPPEQAQQLRAVPHLTVVPAETQRIAFLHVNGSEKTPAAPLRDVRVRQAIFHAIDREAMLKTLVGEGGRLLHALCYPGQFGCLDESVPRYAYDPAKAKQLLAEAGFPNGFEFDLHAYRDRAQTEAIIGYLRAVGIKANLRFMQPAAAREARRSGKVAADHWTWGTGILDVSSTTPVFFGNNPDDMNHDTEVHELLHRGDTTIDPHARQEAYGKALRLIEERAYALPLYTIPIHYIANKDLNFTVYSDEIPRIWEMSWK
jgi:peptide/nickel transport system substrate-binding protein